MRSVILNLEMITRTVAMFDNGSSPAKHALVSNRISRSWSNPGCLFCAPVRSFLVGLVGV
jgi:hypothetical protein